MLGRETCTSQCIGAKTTGPYQRQFFQSQRLRAGPAGGKGREQSANLKESSRVHSIHAAQTFIPSTGYRGSEETK